MRLRRLAWYRLLASLLALWLPLVAGEPGLLQPCPKHGALMASRAAQPPVEAPSLPAAHEHHEHHAATGSSATSAAGDQSAPSHGHDHANCSCIDCCAPAVAAFTAPPAPTVEFARPVVIAASALPNVESLPRPAPAFSRPYTTGPPSA